MKAHLFLILAKINFFFFLLSYKIQAATYMEQLFFIIFCQPLTEKLYLGIWNSYIPFTYT